MNGLIEKIVLADFPSENNYIMQLNGHDVCTSETETINGKIFQIFDFKPEKRSEIFDKFINMTGAQNPYNNSINFSKIDVVKIIIPKNLKLNDTYNIIIHENFITNSTISTHIFNKKIYINNIIDLPLNYPTYCLKLETSNIPVKFSLLINETEYGNFDCKDTLYIYFINAHKIYTGAHNSYLNNSQNDNSINFSRVDSICIVFHIDNMKQIIPTITQMMYKIYNKNKLEAIFDN